MNSVRVITDSHSSISAEIAEKLGVTVIPMPFFIDGKEYFEGVNLTREEFFKRLGSDADVKSSQPAPKAVTDVWDEALNTCDEIVYIPISSGLSGGCATAEALSREEPYLNRVFVADVGRVSTPMYRSVLDALELVKEGYSGRQVKKILEKSRAEYEIYVALDTFEHLKKGGRVSSTSAVLGTLLNIKPVLQFDVGTLHVVQKCRGMKTAKKAMIELLKADLETRFKGREMYIQVAYSTDEETAEQWTREVKEAFPDHEVLAAPLTLAVCCHIGENGLGIGCSMKPERD